ncbi:hypothetical protein SALBM217S_09856 [Streptomyces griseoloalbus]
MPHCWRRGRRRACVAPSGPVLLKAHRRTPDGKGGRRPHPWERRFPPFATPQGVAVSPSATPRRELPPCVCSPELSTAALIALAPVLAGTPSSAAPAQDPAPLIASKDAVPGHYIVTLDAGIDPATLAGQLKAQPTFTYSKALNGFAVPLTPTQLTLVRSALGRQDGRGGLEGLDPLGGRPRRGGNPGRAVLLLGPGPHRPAGTAAGQRLHHPEQRFRRDRVHPRHRHRLHPRGVRRPSRPRLRCYAADEDSIRARSRPGHRPGGRFERGDGRRGAADQTLAGRRPGCAPPNWKRRSATARISSTRSRADDASPNRSSWTGRRSLCAGGKISAMKKDVAEARIRRR